MEAARTFINDFGLVLFAPRPLGAPAPSLVEATLGAAKPSTTPGTTPGEAAIARGLVGRLVAEGSALPLNLLGGPGDLPDFVVSTAAFPFVFTLRGDKGWKRPPETSGAVKVTPLALRVYELLTERGAMTVANMVPEVGREVTDSAISRALGELWAMLRVIPALQPGEGETLWELTTSRFSKAVKAGANAGQPTALSALISLYLGQCYLATEEEIASFLSPLTARSRVREVLHGLVAGRQLSEAVLEGKSVLYIPDALPDFAPPEVAQGGASDGSEGDQEADGELEEGADEPTDATADFDAEVTEDAPEPGQAESRIRRFDGGAGAPLRGKPLRGKPAGREAGSRSQARPESRPLGFRSPGSRGSGPRPSSPRPPRADGEQSRPPFRGSDASDRPARRDAGDGSGRASGGERPSFTRPWEEERGSRPAVGSGETRGQGQPPRTGGGEGRPPRREGSGNASFRPARPREDGRPARREGGNDRPPFRREGGGDRPPFRRRDEAPGERPRRPFTPGERSGAPSDRGERRPFNADRAPRGDRPSFGARGGPGGDRGDRGEARPRSPRPPSNFSDRPFTPRPYVKREGSSFEGRPPRREGGDRPRTDRPNFDRPRPDRASTARPGVDRPGTDRPRTDRPSFDRPRSDRPRPDRPGPDGARTSRPSFNRPSFDRPRSDRSSGGGARPDRPSFDRPRRESGFSRGPGRPPVDASARPSFRPRPSGGAPDRGGSSRGPKREFPGKGGPRGPGGARGPAGFGPARGGPPNRPAPRRKPEDEA